MEEELSLASPIEPDINDDDKATEDNNDVANLSQEGETPQELRSDLDGPYWSTSLFLDNTSDIYWGVNLDNFWWNDNDVINDNIDSNVLQAVSEYVHAESSWVL